MISLLFFNALIFTVQGFDNQIVFNVTVIQNTNKTMDVLCTSANKVYNLKHLENVPVLFKTRKIINSATCTTISNNNEITKSDKHDSKILENNDYIIEKMLLKRDFTSNEGQHQKIICKLLTLEGLTVMVNKQHQVTQADTIYYEATCTADIHVFVVWTEGLDPNRIQYQVLNHSVMKYTFYPTEEVAFVKTPTLKDYKIAINVTYGKNNKSAHTEFTDKFTFPTKVPYVYIELLLIDSNGLINNCFNIVATFSKDSWIEGFKQERLEVSYTSWGSIYKYTFYPNEEVIMRCILDKPGNTAVEIYNDKNDKNLIANGTNILEHKKIFSLRDHKKIFKIYFKTPAKSYDSFNEIEVNLKSFVDVSIETLDWRRVEVSGSNTALEYKYMFYPHERLDLSCSQLKRSPDTKVTFKEFVISKSPSHIGTHDTYVQHSVTLNEKYTGASFVCTLETAAGPQSKFTLLLYFPCKLWFDGFNMGRLNLVSISNETIYFDYLFYPTEQLAITCRKSLLSLDSDKALIHHNFNAAEITNTDVGTIMTTTLQRSDNGTSVECYSEPYQVNYNSFDFKMHIQDVRDTNNNSSTVNTESYSDGTSLYRKTNTDASNSNILRNRPQDVWFSGLDPRAVLEEPWTATQFHTVYNFYPDEVLHFKCVSSNSDTELFVVDANKILQLNHQNKTEVDYTTKPLLKIQNEQFIECNQKNTYYIRSPKEVITARRILKFRLGPIWVEGLPDGTPVTRHDWGLLYEHRFHVNDDINIVCKTTTKTYAYAVETMTNNIKRQSASSLLIKQVLNIEDDGKQINCTILNYTIATSLRTVIINLNLITDNFKNPVHTSIITTASPILKEDNGDMSSWIWKIALGVLLLVFCAFLGWLINDRLKKNKRRNVTRDTSAMNYENLAEDRYCPESSKANQGRVKEATTYAVPKDCLDNDDDPNYAPISNFNNETYAVPYQGDLYAKPVPKCERNKNEMYAQVIPKNKHAAEEMYAEVLPNNKLISKTLDMRGQKYGNTNNGSGTMPIPKPRTLKNNKVQDLYTNVSEIGEEKRNSIYNSSDKEYYSNVNMKDKQYSNTPNQQYVNAERSEYAEPAYCEIPKYVNKK